MELNFTLKNGRYESQEITVTSDYNVHLELESPGLVGLEQRTAGTDFCQGMLSKVVENVCGNTFDFDFSHAVYPKTIRVISLSKVNAGFITMA